MSRPGPTLRLMTAEPDAARATARRPRAVLLVAVAVFIYVRSRRDSIGAHNVNDEWSDAGSAAKQTAGV